jgi:mRNA interferase YafQ
VRTAIRGAQFRKDVKMAQRRGKDLSKLRDAILLLVEGKPLPPQYRDHPLKGPWRHYRDCHIEPDWVLIYRIEGEELHLVRTGSHSDLFRG